MAVKAGQPQVRCDTTGQHMDIHDRWQEDMLQQVTNCCDECIDFSALKEYAYSLSGGELDEKIDTTLTTVR